MDDNKIAYTYKKHNKRLFHSNTTHFSSQIANKFHSYLPKTKSPACEKLKVAAQEKIKPRCGFWKPRRGFVKPHRGFVKPQRGFDFSQRVIIFVA